MPKKNPYADVNVDGLKAVNEQIKEGFIATKQLVSTQSHNLVANIQILNSDRVDLINDFISYCDPAMQPDLLAYFKQYIPWSIVEGKFDTMFDPGKKTEAKRVESVEFLGQGGNFYVWLAAKRNAEKPAPKDPTFRADIVKLTKKALNGVARDDAEHVGQISKWDVVSAIMEAGISSGDIMGLIDEIELQNAA